MSATVTNTGEREADEVVQLYVHQRHGTAARPVRELKGFERVALAAGESRTVTFPLGAEHLRYWNAASRDWVVDPSTYDVWVGGDSTADLHSTFRVTAGDELNGGGRPGQGWGGGGHHLTSVGTRCPRCPSRWPGPLGERASFDHLRELGQQVDDRVSQSLPVDVACAAHLASRGFLTGATSESPPG